jgi:predicted negative regulator of RcsB-dependent stress response
MTTVLIAAFQLGYGIWQSRQQDGETKAIVENIVRQVTSSQQEASNGIRETITNQADRVHADQAGLAKAITAVGEALRDLNEQRSPSGSSGSATKP